MELTPVTSGTGGCNVREGLQSLTSPIYSKSYQPVTPHLPVCRVSQVRVTPHFPRCLLFPLLQVRSWLMSCTIPEMSGESILSILAQICVCDASSTCPLLHTQPSIVQKFPVTLLFQRTDGITVSPTKMEGERRKMNM